MYNTKYTNLRICWLFCDALWCLTLKIYVQVARPNSEVKPNEEKKTSPQRKVFESKRPVTSSSKTRYFAYLLQTIDQLRTMIL